jgi:Zn-dependent M28 family amino/carboxypeptidase
VSTVRPFESPNVVGIMPSDNASGKDQAVLYTAHDDHLGLVPGMPGDKIYNGAADNATAVKRIGLRSLTRLEVSRFRPG